MEYIDAVGIVYDIWVDETQSLVRYEMQKNKRLIELSSDKEYTIKSLIATLNYEETLLGQAYIKNNYYVGGNIFEIREKVAGYFCRIQKHFHADNLESIIKSECRKFFTTFRVEMELKKMLQEPNGEKVVEYSTRLLELFRGNTNLIKELVGKSDDEIARQLKQWARQKDTNGKTLIENPKNNLKISFATELKNAGIIKMSIDRFRRLL